MAYIVNLVLHHTAIVFFHIECYNQITVIIKNIGRRGKSLSQPASQAVGKNFTGSNGKRLYKFIVHEHIDGTFNKKSMCFLNK